MLLYLCWPTDPAKMLLECQLYGTNKLDIFNVREKLNLQDLGYHVVLGMDSNDDVRDGNISAALANIGIKEGVINNHCGESASTTCAKNKQRKTNDSIWTSPDLKGRCCGFLSFHSVYGFVSDHWFLWVEIHNQSMFGHCPQQTIWASVPKVKSNDPANHEKYLEQVLERYKTNNILTSFRTLQQYCMSHCQGTNIYDKIVYLHKELAEKMYKIWSEIDKKMCKFYNISTS